MTTNHIIHDRYDIQLAMIEGTEIEALCTDRFIPEVEGGTGGGAHVPGAPLCERCQLARDITERWNILRIEVERLQAQMEALSMEYRLHRTQWRVERETTREEVTV